MLPLSQYRFSERSENSREGKGTGKHMYFFKAHYVNMETNEEITRPIEFNGQSLDSEKECYIYAMGEAYDLTGKNELFYSLEFIAC